MCIVSNVDAAFAVHVDGSSRTGGFSAIGAGNSPPVTVPSMQEAVALSPCADEYYGLSDITKKILEEINLLGSFGYVLPITIV